ncbi:hypothetical protein Bhyg_07642, partial [Pseudolycoriella hygida]
YQPPIPNKSGNEATTLIDFEETTVILHDLNRLAVQVLDATSTTSRAMDTVPHTFPQTRILESNVAIDITNGNTMSMDGPLQIDMPDKVVGFTSFSSETPRTIEPFRRDALVKPVPNETNVIDLKGAKMTQSSCFICHSGTGRKTVPWPAIQQAWFETRCYIPNTNRSCEEHFTSSNKFTDDALRMIADAKADVSVKMPDFQLWLYGISDMPKSTPYSFEEDGIEAEKYKIFLGLSKEHFDDLLTYLKAYEEIPVFRLAYQLIEPK